MYYILVPPYRLVVSYDSSLPVVFINQHKITILMMTWNTVVLDSFIIVLELVLFGVYIRLPGFTTKVRM